ncbi:hypothetical protein [Streptomyces colonosanans]|nr:hypothetical protein [Streptomyces colonosanans]
MPFFATLYVAALRPEEAVELRLQDCQLPKKGPGLLMDTYYKCIHGQREQMVQRIIDALGEDPEGGTSDEVD